MSDILNSAIAKVQGAKHAFCRFITVNDTGNNGSHQSGFYIPKCAAPLLFDTPGRRGENKDKAVRVQWQDDFITESRFIYYGQKSRNEYRITRFGRGFPFFGEDNVGDLLVLAGYDDDYYYGYVLQSDEDIEDFFAHFGLSSQTTNQLIDTRPLPTSEELVAEGIKHAVAMCADFPDTRWMAQHAMDIFNAAHGIEEGDILADPDKQLLNWNATEYELFRSLEDKLYAAIYSHPFSDCQSLIAFSNTILNRRKSRAGKSLEHHLASIFTTAKLRFEEQAMTEDKKRPDFLFPDGVAYHNLLFPAEDLVFLGAKTTCKDRWRQILDEAARIETKHLFTMQQGIPASQLLQMRHAKVRLVVPAQYKKSFAPEYQSDIDTLQTFIEFVRQKQA